MSVLRSSSTSVIAAKRTAYSLISFHARRCNDLNKIAVDRPNSAAIATTTQQLRSFSNFITRGSFASASSRFLRSSASRKSITSSNTTNNAAVQTTTTTRLPTQSIVKRTLFDVVIIDVEATGMSPYNDRLIEVAGVRMHGLAWTGQYCSLINPEMPLPEEVKDITKLNNWLLRNSPQYTRVLREFSDFIGDSPILGHNIAFDAAFLVTEMNRYGVPLPPSLRNFDFSAQEKKISKHDVEQKMLIKQQREEYRASGTLKITKFDPLLMNHSNEDMVVDFSADMSGSGEIIGVKSSTSLVNLVNTDAPSLCTLKIARRLFPELKSHSLGDLARHLKIPITRQHRALDDAMMTAKLWCVIFRTVQKELGYKPDISVFQKLCDIPKGDVRDFFQQQRKKLADAAAETNL